MVFQQNGLTVTENQSLFFQAEDKDGNILATNSISIYKLGKLNPNNLTINIDRSNNKYIHFTPFLLNCDSTYYSLYCKIETSDSAFSICKGTNFFNSFNKINDFRDFYEITPGEAWKAHGTSKTSFKLLFKVVNKASNTTVLTKSYTLTFDYVDGTTIDEGFINEGTDDEQPITPENDSNVNTNDYTDNPFSNITQDSSLEEMIDAAEMTFSTFFSAFRILPSFIWALIGILITVCIALRVLGR